MEATKYESFTGNYLVKFPQQINHCVVLADQGAIPVFGSPGGSSGRDVGPVDVDLSGEGFTYKNGYPSADTVQVEAFSGSTAANGSFYIAAFC